MLSHIKDEAIVEVWPLCTNSIGANLPASTIHNVERVIYTDNARDINDPGKTIEELEDRLSKERENFDNLSALYEKTEAEYRVTVAKLEAYKATEPKPEYKINLRAVTPMGSDRTQDFEVENCEGMRLVEFITEIAAGNDLGKIVIREAERILQVVEFKNHKTNYDHMLDDRIVKRAKGSGGWGRMDYQVTVNCV
jgi:hypothetical protein